MFLKYSNFFQKLKILNKNFCLDLFQGNSLKKATDNQTQECNYRNECKLIRNFGTNISVKSFDSSTPVNKYMLNLLNSILIKYFIESYQIELLDIKKINFANGYKINFYLSGFFDNLNFINEIDKLKKNIIIQSFKMQLPINLKKNFIENNIFLSIYLIPCFDKKSPFKLLTLNKKYSISVPEKGILTKFPLNEIKLLGFLSDNKNKTFELIGLPNKKICKIMLGSYLGIEQALVIGIYPEKVIILNNKSNEIMSLSNKHGN
jgi:hypothetical protein